MCKRKNIRCLRMGLTMVLLLLLLNGCAVVNLEDGKIIFGGKVVAGEEDMSTFEEVFDSDTYVQSIWEEEALPVFAEQANDLTTVTAAIAQDFEQACKEYGILSNDKGSWVFVVQGEGIIGNINRESRNGLAIIAVADLTTQLQIGPVYKGASLRDSLPFIQFNDFKNQIAFSEVSSALNRMVDESVIASSGIDEGTGKQVSFTGAFSIKSANDNIMIIPVMLEVGR
jgi:Predicted periplasmic lipoprotein